MSNVYAGMPGRGVMQNAMQATPVNDEVGGAVPGLGTVAKGNACQFCATQSVADTDRKRPAGHGCNRFEKTDLRHDPGDIGTQLNSCADLERRAVSFEHGDTKAPGRDAERRGQPADTAAGDQDIMAGICRHVGFLTLNGA